MVVFLLVRCDFRQSEANSGQSSRQDKRGLNWGDWLQLVKEVLAAVSRLATLIQLV